MFFLYSEVDNFFKQSFEQKKTDSTIVVPFALALVATVGALRSRRAAPAKVTAEEAQRAERHKPR